MINSGDKQLKITQKWKLQRGANAKKEIKLKSNASTRKIKNMTQTLGDNVWMLFGYYIPPSFPKHHMWMPTWMLDKDVK